MLHYPAAGAGIRVSPAPDAELQLLVPDKLHHLRHVLGASGDNDDLRSVSTLAIINLKSQFSEPDVSMSCLHLDNITVIW